MLHPAGPPTHHQLLSSRSYVQVTNRARVRNVFQDYLLPQVWWPCLPGLV